MNEELEKKLKNALKKAGLAEGLFDAFKEQSEEAIEAFIKKINPNSTPTIDEIIASNAFEKYLEEGGFDKLLSNNKKAQSAFDKKVGKALNTFKKNLLGEDGNGTEPTESKPDGSGDDNPMMALLTKMSNEIKELKEQRTREDKQQGVKSLLSKSNLPEKYQTKWFGRIDSESETSVEDQIKELEAEYSELTGGESGNTGSYNFDQSRGNANNGKLSKTEEKELAEMAKAMSSRK